ncbi:SDR family oxidoreductase [Reichenbachiella sp. MALMAid0571]|uniref:SDR family oxidoreductase n=1 Tax=Reichenbachiella sp. MALMAid0571 TaxID=3143939 RepID=UPI0032DEEE50
MNINLSGKQAIVCGSTQGIGKAIAEELAELGASVVLVARNEESLKAALSTLSQNEHQLHEYIVADFGEPLILKQRIEDFINRGNQPEILINNTGGPSGGQILDEQYEKFSDTLSAHLQCNHLLVQELSPCMMAKGYGRIINIISTSVKQPIPGLGVSNTVRGAVASWAKTLSYELAPFGITVNNVLPGFTATTRLDYVIENLMQKTGKSREEVVAGLEADIPARRIGAAHEVASLAAFLSTPAAAYINGTSIPVDGGKTTAI